MKSLVDFILEAKREKIEGDGYVAFIEDTNQYKPEILAELTKKIQDEVRSEEPIKWLIFKDAIKGSLKGKVSSKYSNKIHIAKMSYQDFKNDKTPKDKLQEIIKPYCDKFPNHTNMQIEINGDSEIIK